MNEEPKSIWKKSWTGWRGLLLGWLILMAVLLVCFLLLLMATGTPLAKSDNELRLFGVAGIVVTLIFLLATFVRWVCCWRNFKRFLFGLACFATLIALAYAEEDWRGKHDWEKFKREWEAKGEIFDYAKIVPPPVPDNQNFAMRPIWIESIEAAYGSNVTWQWYGKKLTAQEQAKLVDHLNMPLTQNDSDWPTNGHGNLQKATLTDLTPWQNYYRTLAAKTNLFPVAPQPQTPPQDVLLALSKYDPAIEELREASQLPYSRFPLYSDADHPFDTLLPHLAEFKRCAQVLELRAVAELQNAESEKALADVKLSLRLTDAMRTEPFLISHLVRIAMVQIILQPVYEGLANHQWSDAQLVELDSELAKLNFLADFELSMRGERAASIAALDYMRRSRKMEFGDDASQRIIQKINWLVPSAFFYQNELTIARLHQQYFMPMADATTATVFPARVKDLDKKSDQDMNRHYWPYKIFAKMLTSALTASVKKFSYAQGAVVLARTAIALERFQIAHGNFPDSLDALAPQFISAAPRDVIDGQPLHYRKTADQNFILYSVGWNETDDGGVVVFKKGLTPDVDRDRGDWVWRYPPK